MVTLYDPLGQGLSFSKAAWEELLATASRYGWTSKGTVAPPLSLDCLAAQRDNWDGNYSCPAGQTVVPKDAQALATAIGQALENGAEWKFNDEQSLRTFMSFCQNRGFLISVHAMSSPSQEHHKHPEPVPETLKKRPATRSGQKISTADTHVAVIPVS